MFLVCSVSFLSHMVFLSQSQAWYQNISEEEKDKMPINTKERYQNFTEEENESCNKKLSEEKKKPVEYSRNYYLTHKK